MAPTSEAPCTLFWPRIGSIAAPQRPIMPQANIMLRNEVTMSVPLACCVRPIAHSELVFGPRAYISAARRIFSAGIPVILAEKIRRAAEMYARGPNTSSLRSEEHTSELPSLAYLGCRLLLE